MNDLAITLPNTGDVASITDANELANIMKTAHALIDLSSDFEKTTQVLKVRNHAMRRLGQMYYNLPTKQAGGDHRHSDTMSRSQFQKELELSETDMLKIRSLADMEMMTFEERETLDRDPLWEGTRYYEKLMADRQRIKDALAAKKREENAKAMAEVEAVDERGEVQPLHPTARTPVPRPEPVFGDTAQQRAAVAEADKMLNDIFSPKITSQIKALSMLGNFDWVASLSSHQKAELWTDCDKAMDVLSNIQARCQS